MGGATLESWAETDHRVRLTAEGRDVATSGSKGAVAAAIAGNTVVMCAKFFGFFMTGSGAMLSEAIHTLADLMNQILLMIGISRSERAPTSKYEYGFGQEQFVWALISAVGIFFLGCGVTVYHGITTLLHPHPMGELGWAVGVLLFSLAIEGWVLMVALRGLKRAAAGRPFFKYLREKGDPSTVAVLLEDSAACAGVLIALACIGLASWTGQLWWDGVGSILIGLILGAVAIWLIARNRELLVGRSADPETRARILEVLNRQGVVEAIVDVKSRMMDSENVDLTVAIDFEGRRIADMLDGQLRARWDAGFADYDAFRTFAGTFADDVIETLGDEVDRIEAAIAEAVPSVKHIDIEPN